jgi:hypothetical protein
VYTPLTFEVPSLPDESNPYHLVTLNLIKAYKENQMLVDKLNGLTKENAQLRKKINELEYQLKEQSKMVVQDK